MIALVTIAVLNIPVFLTSDDIAYYQQSGFALDFDASATPLHRLAREIDEGKRLSPSQLAVLSFGCRNSIANYFCFSFSGLPVTRKEE